MLEMRKMKDSGIEWIGEIPEGWETIKLKNMASIVRGGSPRPIEAYMSDNDNDVNWIRISDTEKGSKYITHACRKLISSGISKSRFIKRGSLILTNSMSFGEPYILAIDGCIHDGWVAFSDFTKIGKEFLYYFLVSPLAKLQFEQQVDGGVVKNLNIDKIGDTIILLPPYNEQNKIIAYLDCFTSNIDLLLSKTISSIEEYKKLKQAVITQAVTKGVRGEREMKDSGVEWIGEIPKEWSIPKIKRLHNGLTDGTHGTFNRIDSGHVLLSSKNVREFGIQLGENESFISEADYNLITANGFPQKDDVLLCCIGASIGRCTLYEFEETMAFQRSVIFIRCNSLILPRMMMYELRSNSTLLQEQLLVNQSAQAGLYQGLVSEIFITLPPICEQKEIVDYLDAKCAEIDRLIAKKEQLVKELESYKKSLIYEVVTGKREV